MATRLKDVHIEDAVRPFEFRLWSDLSEAQLLGIEGIANIFVYPNGSIGIEVDRRYCIESVKDEIYALAGVERPS